MPTGLAKSALVGSAACSWTVTELGDFKLGLGLPDESHSLPVFSGLWSGPYLYTLSVVLGPRSLGSVEKPSEQSQQAESWGGEGKDSPERWQVWSGSVGGREEDGDGGYASWSLLHTNDNRPQAEIWVSV